MGLEVAIGDEGGAGTKPLAMDSVFSIFSATKAITNVLVFRAIERGQLMLTTKVSEIIKEFSGGIRERITVFDLLTHTSGLPQVFTPKAGMNIDQLHLVIEAICENVHAVCEPQERVDSPLANHALLGEMVRRTDAKGRRYRDIVHQDLLDPLKMTSSAIGRPERLKSRHVVPVFGANAPTQHPSSRVPGINAAFEDPDAEMPWRGCGVLRAGPVPFRRDVAAWRRAGRGTCALARDPRARDSQLDRREAGTRSTRQSPIARAGGRIRRTWGSGSRFAASECIMRCYGTRVPRRLSETTARAARSSGWTRFAR